MAKDEPVDGAKIAALILSRLPAKDQDRLVKAIQAADPKIAAKLEDRLYNFEKLADLKDQTVQNLLHEVPHRDIVVSLKAAPEKVREKILENMSDAKQRLVEEDVQELPPMRLTDVQAAQRRILRKLEELYPGASIEDDPKSRQRLA